jgi:xanthine dehydrogenase accessory protein XdhC
MAEGPLAPVLRAMMAANEPAALIRIARTFGSTPREAGATMVAGLTRTIGTIGGGQLEFHAIDMAREMLAAGDGERRLALTLGPQMGQCCGGKVHLHIKRAAPADVEDIERREAADMAARPHVLILGAGHTGRTLARQLALLPFRTTLVDDRPAELAQCEAPVESLLRDDPETALATAPAGSAALVMTHSHALDYRLAEAALRTHCDGAPRFAYVGMIGSATKRARFLAGLRRAGAAPCDLAAFHCPIGGTDLADKRPAIIAALAVAEVVRALMGGQARQAASPSRESAA